MNEDFNKYDEKILDVDEVIGTDIKINPDFYIHNAIVKAQNALNSQDFKQGIIQFRLNIENIEILCKAGGMLPDDYNQQIEDYKKSEDYAEEKELNIKNFRLANKKLEILLTNVFSSKVSTTPLRH